MNPATSWSYTDWSVEALVQEREALQWRLAELEASPEPDESAECIQNGMLLIAECVLEINGILDKRRNLLRKGYGPHVDRPGQVDVFRTVKERITLEDFCARYGPILRPQGARHWGLCPMPDHHEKTPSFAVTPARQQWYCHGCNRGGDIFHLAQYMFQEPSTIAAARKLAEEFGIDIGTPPSAPRGRVTFPRAAA
jgi:hypothetical protein